MIPTETGSLGVEAKTAEIHLKISVSNRGRQYIFSY